MGQATTGAACRWDVQTDQRLNIMIRSRLHKSTESCDRGWINSRFLSKTKQMTRLNLSSTRLYMICCGHVPVHLFNNKLCWCWFFFWDRGQIVVNQGPKLVNFSDEPTPITSNSRPLGFNSQIHKSLTASLLSLRCHPWHPHSRQSWYD